MLINLTNVQIMFNLILNTLERNEIKAIEIYEDWYWTLAYEEAYYAFLKKPAPEVGSLVDDWEWLEKILCNKNPSTTLDFERLGNVIRVLGKNIHQQEAQRKSLFSIKITEIAKLITILLQKAHKAGFETISIDINTYWSVKPEDEYNLNEEPGVIEKSFKNDWDYLKNNLNDSNATSSYAFESFSRLLMIIGEEINNSPLKANWLICE